MIGTILGHYRIVEKTGRASALRHELPGIEDSGDGFFELRVETLQSQAD